MRLWKRILLWIAGIVIGLPALLYLAFPLISMFAVDAKYERFAEMHPVSEAYYLAEIEGAQPGVACGGTAGQYNWGEETRRYQSLNGLWDVSEGGNDDEFPEAYAHQTPVPGLLTSAAPAFDNVGIEHESRDAFWYRRHFTAPEQMRDTALLCIAKAKYGVRAWLNGVLLGDHYGAFTQAEFILNDAIRWGESNELIVRVGAERSQLPPFIPAGHDHEKTHYIPGIWDDVNVIYTGSQTVVRVKVETDIQSGESRIKTTLKNSAAAAVDVTLSQSVGEWKGAENLISDDGLLVTLEAGESRVVSQSLKLNEAHLWTLDDPFLYVLQTQVKDKTGRVIDDRATRFGYRHVEWKAGDEKGFYLNGEKVLLRGSNFSLHRFFEDEKAGNLVWNEAWVRKLYTSYPKDYQWNIFRTSIGRLPNFWYDIADEEGFLIDDEFAYWTLVFPPGEKGNHIDRTHLNWSIVEMEKEFTSWIQESWNHPAIAMWSASNETVDVKSPQVIARVRHLDATRQWENGGWQKPHGEADPIEDHPYVFSANFNPIFEMLGVSAKGIEALDDKDGQPIPRTNMMGMTYPSDHHAHIVNEYGWLWINRNGEPTLLTGNVYENLLGDAASPETRRETYAYLHAGLTGFWRAKRGYQGVQHFSYLNHSKPGTGYTSDNFIDLENLVMEPRWHEYHRHVWSPVAVYVDKWTDDFARGQSSSIPLIVINDLNENIRASVELIVTSPAGDVLATSASVDIKLAELDQQHLALDVDIPDAEQLVLYARLRYGDELSNSMVDRRKWGFPHPGVVVADLPDL